MKNPLTPDGIEPATFRTTVLPRSPILTFKFPKCSLPAGFMNEIKDFSSQKVEISHSQTSIIPVFTPE